MTPTRISVRVNERQLQKAQKALRARTTSETVQKALDLVTEKAAHDRVIRRYSGAGTSHAFKED
jgi:hypothetical protein